MTSPFIYIEAHMLSFASGSFSIFPDVSDDAPSDLPTSSLRPNNFPTSQSTISWVREFCQKFSGVSVDAPGDRRASRRLKRIYRRPNLRPKFFSFVSVDAVIESFDGWAGGKWGYFIDLGRVLDSDPHWIRILSPWIRIRIFGGPTSGSAFEMRIRIQIHVLIFTSKSIPVIIKTQKILFHILHVMYNILLYNSFKLVLIMVQMFEKISYIFSYCHC